MRISAEAHHRALAKPGLHVPETPDVLPSCRRHFDFHGMDLLFQLLVHDLRATTVRSSTIAATRISPAYLTPPDFADTATKPNTRSDLAPFVYEAIGAGRNSLHDLLMITRFDLVQRYRFTRARHDDVRPIFRFEVWF